MSKVNVIEADNLADEIAQRAAQIILQRLAEKGAIVAHNPEPEEILNASQACKEVRLSRPTFDKYVKEGLIPCIFNGTKTPRFRLSDIRAYQQSTKK